MKTLLLVTHRRIDEVGGASARWKAFARYLPDHGWNVVAISPPARASVAEFTVDPHAQKRVARRARAMRVVGAAAAVPARGLGLRPEAFPPSVAWSRAGARELRRRVVDADAVLATAPPIAGLIAGRMGAPVDGPPFIAELRDLWAGNPAFDVRGGLLGRIENWIFGHARAAVVMTPEAERDLLRRHPDLAERTHVIPNGFDPTLYEISDASAADTNPDRIVLVHTGVVNAGRPPWPLIEVLMQERYRSRFRLVLHGYITPDVQARLANVPRDVVETAPPSDWEDAVVRIARGNVGVVLQGESVGDSTAVASKVYEYLAMGKPVLTVTDGGATEGLLRRLAADQLAARLSDPSSIARALDRLLADPPTPVDRAQIEPFSRRQLATDMAALLDSLTS